MFAALVSIALATEICGLRHLGSVFVAMVLRCSRLLVEVTAARGFRSLLGRRLLCCAASGLRFSRVQRCLSDSCFAELRLLSIAVAVSSNRRRIRGSLTVVIFGLHWHSLAVLSGRSGQQLTAGLHSLGRP